MADHASDTSHRMTKHAKETEAEGHNLIDTAGEYIDTAKEFVQEKYEAVVEKTGEVKESTEKMIKKNPWIAVGVALGVGVVLGMLLKSRRD
jgi:ElaB/YqjD/DUF883 family membrane-anchored ribosome-binding protein